MSEGYRVLRASDHRRTKWKNGQGETVEIAVFPEGASIDDFDWRVSTASVPRTGRFSTFAGVDRTLAVLEGEMRLTIEGMAEVAMTVRSNATTFPGDSPTHASVTSPVVDLNIMVRRGRFRARLDRLQSLSIEAIERGAGERLVFFGGGGELADGTMLSPRDVLRLDGERPVRLRAIPENAWTIDIIVNRAGFSGG